MPMSEYATDQSLASDAPAATLLSRMLSTLSASIEPFAPTKVVVALSGGLDSMLLLELMTRLSGSFTLQAVYVDHGLSANAKAWGLFCQQQCQLRQVDCQVVAVQIADRQRNIEAQARSARYQALAEFMTAPTQLMLTAHHADDQAETLLLALKRGSGLDGLTGIAKQKQLNQGFLVRPLLAFSRVELVKVATFLGIAWIEDESNQNLDFDRNFIRQQILPLLQQRFTRFSQNASRSAALLQEAQQWQQQQLEPCLAAMVDTHRLDLTKLAQLDPLSQRLFLRAFIKQHGIVCSQLQLENLLHQLVQAKADAQVAVELAGKCLRRFQQFLYVLDNQQASPTQTTAPQLDANWPVNQFRAGQAAQNLIWQQPLAIAGAWLYWTDQPSVEFANAEFACWPLAQTKNSALSVQTASMSQRFKPAGQLTKPLKQWCQLWHIPPWQRQALQTVVFEDQIVVVLGYGSRSALEEAQSWLHVYPQFPDFLQPAISV